MLALEEPVLRTQYFELVGDPNPFPELTVCGYTQNENIFYQISQKTRINLFTKSLDGLIYYNIDTIPGQSGCPVYIENKENVKLVGIHISSSL